jgi:hypothetical protein
MDQINKACEKKLNKSFPLHVQQLFSNLVVMASELDNPSQEVSIWWEPEDIQEGDLVPSITFRLTPIQKGENATPTDS